MADEDPAGLTPEERKYFTSRGEADIPAPHPPAAPPEPPPAPVADADATAEARGGSVSSPEDADKSPPVQDLKADRQKMVPHSALHEERTLRQAAEERVRQAELMQARMEERFKMMMDAGKPPPVAPKPPPRADQDIFGAVDHLSKEIDRRGKEIDGYKERLAGETRQKQMDDWARSHEAEFIKETPDYYQALHYLRLGRSLELNALGVVGQQQTEQLNNEERALMQRAATIKKSPAELAYSLAKARGYDRAAVERATAAARAQQQDPNKRLDVVEAGQKQSGSMANVGGTGGRGSGDITLADLVKMPDDEFLKFRAKNPAKYRQLKGAEH